MSDFQPTALALQLAESKVNPADAAALSSMFLPFSEQAEAIKDIVYSLTVTSPDQVDIIRKAREYRLKLKNLRVESEKVKKREKEESLRKGQAIDAVFRYILSIIVPMEEHLEKQENFVKLQEEQAKASRKAEREQALVALEVDVSFYNLGDMPGETYAKLLHSSQEAFTAKKAAAEKAEQERLAREKAEAEERERIRVENERLRKEAAEKQAALDAEREAAAKERAAAEEAQRKKDEEHRAAMEAERKERERIEAEALAKQREQEKAERERREAEEKARLDQEAARRQAELAPDKEKLVALANRIAAVEMPSVESAEAKTVIENAIGLLTKASQYVRAQSINL
jgi:hypothetical protein